MFEAKIIAHSISEQGKEIITYQLKYPRYIHAELMTHRVFSRNAGSSRAIPVAKLAEKAIEEMVEPIRYLKNQAGMQAKNEELEGESLTLAKTVWRRMAETCADGAKELASLGLHKQWANRPLEWFSNISVVVTSTEWDNWYELRNHADAQPEIRELAYWMLVAKEKSTPTLLLPGQWHAPYIQVSWADESGNVVSLHYINQMFPNSKEPKSIKSPPHGSKQSFWLVVDGVFAKITLEEALKSSAAYCARVSYSKHDGTSATLAENIELHDRLVDSAPIHASPIEHQASPDKQSWWTRLKELFTGRPRYCNEQLHGNFKGYVQHRKYVERGIQDVIFKGEL